MDTRDKHVRKLDELLSIYTIRDLAKLLGVGHPSVYNWDRDRAIPLKHRERLARIWEEHIMDKAESSCVFTVGVECSEHNCQRCGFNPAEERRRIQCWASSSDSSQASV